MIDGQSNNFFYFWPNISLLCMCVFHFRLEADLCKYETNRERLKSNDPQYKAKLQELMDKQQFQLLNRIHSLSCERWFLFQLKTRYSGKIFVILTCRVYMNVTDVPPITMKIQREGYFWKLVWFLKCNFQHQRQAHVFVAADAERWIN